MSGTFSVLGMSCGGCANSVTNAIKEAAPQADVNVDLDAKSVTVSGADEATVKQAVEGAGFEFAGVA
ncbi:heavy-metal-associated domain-containing protein [Magnetovibrio sp. PR-2]|uniref:heavy-metal-associated domain-containing protein n=1 Tax=Magnetovibrio sp. PR-2 TaxID=3120356 RepID=UPI002FCE2CCC